MNLSFSCVWRYGPMPGSVTWLSGSAFSFMCGKDRDGINLWPELEMSFCGSILRVNQVGD